MTDLYNPKKIKIGLHMKKKNHSSFSSLKSNLMMNRKPYLLLAKESKYITEKIDEVDEKFDGVQYIIRVTTTTLLTNQLRIVKYQSAVNHKR